MIKDQELQLRSELNDMILSGVMFDKLEPLIKSSFENILIMVYKILC